MWKITKLLVLQKLGIIKYQRRFLNLVFVITYIATRKYAENIILFFSDICGTPIAAYLNWKLLKTFIMENNSYNFYWDRLFTWKRCNIYCRQGKQENNVWFLAEYKQNINDFLGEEFSLPGGISVRVFFFPGKEGKTGFSSLLWNGLRFSLL